MSANKAIEKLKVLKAIIERLNMEMSVIINKEGEAKLVFIKNNLSERKYSLLEKKVDSLICNFN